ncbi:MGMT family protein [Leucobacter salsicius]|uniref:MGMT family protein n=1 Tax=Leucobacter salsicius TaxID=664638 RepID=UPI00034A1E61|nr:MGMT family protein [Leucobacter salsicius]
MPSPEFVDTVLGVVRRIPAGRVMTYGDVALAIGSNAPRAVGRVLALYGHAVPWWRVVPASGLPPQGHARPALPHYLEEATPLRYAASEGSLTTVSPDAPEYRLALSSARLPYTHEIYAEVAL